jgi:hypothetical protein
MEKNSLKCSTGIEICLGVPLQSVQLFLPVIIKRLGYNTVKVCYIFFRATICSGHSNDYPQDKPLHRRTQRVWRSNAANPGFRF